MPAMPASAFSKLNRLIIINLRGGCDNEKRKQSGYQLFSAVSDRLGIPLHGCRYPFGHFIPASPSFLNRFEYARVSIPMVLLIWVMIYPMMLKVDFQSVQNVGKNPKGLFVVIPLAGGILTRILVVRKMGMDYFENVFIHKFDSVTTVGLLLTLVLIFMGQSEVILGNPLHIFLIAIPLVIQTFLFDIVPFISQTENKKAHCFYDERTSYAAGALFLRLKKLVSATVQESCATPPVLKTV